MIFGCQLKADRDERGQLQACTVTWCEPREVTETLIGALATLVGVPAVLVIVACFVLLLAGWPWVVLAGLILGVAVLGVGCALAWSGERVPGRMRAIAFSSSGAIESPLGLVHYSRRAFRWRNSWHDIINFESEKVSNVGYSHGVRVINRQGDVFHIAASLHPDHAHKLATMLTLGLLAIRDETAGGAPKRSQEKQVIN